MKIKDELKKINDKLDRLERLVRLAIPFEYTRIEREMEFMRERNEAQGKEEPEETELGWVHDKHSDNPNCFTLGVRKARKANK